MINEEDMIEQSAGIKLLIANAKTIMALIFIFLVEPIYDFIVLQVDKVAFLSDITKAWLADIKLIIVLLTAIIVMVRVLLNTIKLIREMKKK